uniref:MACPF domain-containing protein n=1 Tax=Strigamia maritima TaxID=126957 RepID=T1IXM8_STRMM
MKSLLVKNGTFICRSEMRQVVYRVHIAALMDDAVKGRFVEVIRSLVRDKTEEAKILTEKIVSDYGSHYSNNVDVGAVIVKEDYLTDDFLRAHDVNRNKILLASKLSLLGTGFPWEHKEDLDSSLLSDYNDAIVDKKIRFFGALNWEKGAKAEYVVAVDKSGNLLSNINLILLRIYVYTNYYSYIKAFLLIKLYSLFNMFSTRNQHYGIICLISLVSYAKLEEPCADGPKLKILPGFGWDALKDKDTEQLLQVTYDQCKTTFDGKLLIPDNADALALQSQEIEVKSYIFEHWSTYNPPTSASFKFETNVWPKEFLPLYYSLSDNHKEMKSLLVKNGTFICRSEMRQVVYRVHIAALMDDAVKGRFVEVIRSLVRDKTEEAKILTEKILSDYGTHYSNIVDVGAVIVKEDYLTDDFLRAHDGNRRKILSASKLSLLAIGFPWKYTQDLDSSLLSEYNDAIVDKKIRFFGALNWEEGAKAEYVVAVDKSGDLLSGLVTSSNFPNAKNTTLIRVRQLFNDAIRDYYARNIHRGCTQPKSNNFEFAANIDDGSCCNSVTSSNCGNLEEIIQRQETEISLLKQQMVHHESNYSMKIQNLEENFGKIIERQETEFKRQMVYLESNHSMKIQDLKDKFAEDKIKLSNKIEEIEKDLSNKIATLIGNLAFAALRLRAQQRLDYQ